MKRYILIAAAAAVIVCLTIGVTDFWKSHDDNRYEVVDCWIDSLSATLHITVLMPDSVLKEMARIGTSGADVEFVGPNLSGDLFESMMLDGIEKRAKYDRAAKALGESIDRDVPQRRNNGIFDKERRR